MYEEPQQAEEWWMVCVCVSAGTRGSVRLHTNERMYVGVCMCWCGSREAWEAEQGIKL